LLNFEAVSPIFYLLSEWVRGDATSSLPKYDYDNNDWNEYHDDGGANECYDDRDGNKYYVDGDGNEYYYYDMMMEIENP
jgi:hypothetical protein